MSRFLQVIRMLWRLWRALPPDVRGAARVAVESAKHLPTLADHTARREWAVRQVMSQAGAKENPARLAVEALVGLLKRG